MVACSAAGVVSVRPVHRRPPGRPASRAGRRCRTSGSRAGAQHHPGGAQRLRRLERIAAVARDRLVQLVHARLELARIPLGERAAARSGAASEVRAFSGCARARTRSRLQRRSCIGWWQAWQSNTTSSGKRPSRAAFGSISTSRSSRRRAPARSPTRARVPGALGVLPVSVDHEMRRLRLRERLQLELIAGGPRPSCGADELVLVPKWQERHSRAAPRARWLG